MAFAPWQIGKWTSSKNGHERIMRRGADEEAMPRQARDVPLPASEPQAVFREDLVSVHTKGRGARVSARWHVQSTTKLIDQEDRIEGAVPDVQLDIERAFQRAAPAHDGGKENEDRPHAGESTRA
jgi:hypothetical protein